MAAAAIALSSLSLVVEGCGDEPAVAEQDDVARTPVVATPYDMRTIYSTFPVLVGLAGGQVPDLNDAAWKLFEQQVTTIFNDAKSVTSVLGAITGGISTVTTVLQLLGFLDQPADEVATLTASVNSISNRRCLAEAGRVRGHAIRVG